MASSRFAHFPRTFASHSRPGARQYRICDDHFVCAPDAPAVRGRTPLAVLDGAGPTGAALAVFAGEPPEGLPNTDDGCRPAYAFAVDEQVAVPTGRAFVQANGDVAALPEVLRLGYRIESVPAYAPQAAWLVASDGSIATALAQLGALAALAGITSVEPQMLRPKRR